MNTKIILVGTLLGLTLAAVAIGKDAAPMRMGDGTVQGKRLDDYEIVWLQCSIQEQGWVSGGQLTESLVSTGDVLRVTQRAERPNGIVSVATTTFERSSLAPRRMEQQATGPDGNVLVTVTRDFSEKGYSGESRKGDQVTELGGTINSSMWHGGALGLPLATIDADRYPVEFASSMVAFHGTYRTIATLAGRETLQHEGAPVEALLVDVEWHHIESGDIYPPGPDASGGRYWLLPDPPDNYPYVPQYRTDTYLVSTLMDECPGNEPAEG